MTTALSMDQVLIEKLKKILEVNLDKEHFGVKELAKEAGLSRSQLHRKLQSIVGKSASKFIREFRLDKAMVMLQNNEATASEIAYRVGFSSPTYFSTCFNDYYGYPPGEVKFRIKKNLENNKSPENLELTDSQILTESPPVKKGRIRKRMVWVNTALIFLLAVVSFSLYKNYKNTTKGEIAFKEKNEKSIAILPFKNLSDDAENQYFADGVSGAIQNNLTKISELMVIPSTSMEKYRNTDLSVTEIAKEVNVTYLLEGSVQKHGDSIRVISNLVDAINHEQLQSFVFDWEYMNIFDIQSKIALEVAKELDITIAPKEVQNIQEQPTKNIKAYNLYLQASYQAKQVNEKAYENAIRLFEKANSLDSTFIDSQYGLAEVLFQSGLFFGIIKEDEAWEKAKLISERALKLDSTHIKLNDLLYNGYFYFDWNFDLVEDYYQKRTVSEDFGRDLGIDVDYAIKTGRAKEALIAINERMRRNPLSIWTYPVKASAFFHLGRKKEASELLNENNILYDDLYYLIESSKIHIYLSEFEESRIQLNKVISLYKDRPPIVLWLLAVHNNLEGNQSKVEEYLFQLRLKYQQNDSGSPAWFLALYYCSVEEYDEAITWLQKSYDRHEVEMLWFREEPVLKPLRNDPRYLDLYEKVGFPIKPRTL